MQLVPLHKSCSLSGMCEVQCVGGMCPDLYVENNIPYSGKYRQALNLMSLFKNGAFKI